MDAYTKADGLGIFLSGGASNLVASDSLGGAISSRPVRGMSVIHANPVQGLMIENASPDNGEGSASIFVDDDGDAAYTPPGGSQGTAVAIGAGTRKILTGVDTDKYVRVYRESGKTWKGTATFDLVDMLNGVLSMSDIDDTDRQAGEVHYRGIFLKALEDVQDILVWITTDGQAAFALAGETPVADEIQIIADEDTAPAAVDWVNATTIYTALSLGHLSEGDTFGVWIRRTFVNHGRNNCNTSKHAIRMHGSQADTAANRSAGRTAIENTWNFDQF